MTTDALTDLEAEVLTFERRRWRHSGAKATAVRAAFGWTLNRHEQVVLGLLDRPAALVADPELVWRLRRLREHRREARTGAG